MRELCIGNGRLLVSFDDRYRLCELVFPRMQRDNRIGSSPGRLGFADSSRRVWTHDDSWRIRSRYLKETLVGSVSLANNQLQLVCRCCDAVDVSRSILVRQITVRNLLDYPRTITVLYYQDFRASGPSQSASCRCANDPTGLFFQDDDCYMLVGFRRDDGPADVRGAVGSSIRDLLGDVGPTEGITTTSSSGMIATDLELGGFAETRIYLVIVLARDESQLADDVNYVDQSGPQAILDRACGYWRLWSTGTNINFGNLPARVVDLFKRSLLTIRAHIHTNGAIADGSGGFPQSLTSALIAHALDLAGQPEPSRWFYRLCNRRVRAADLSSGDEDGQPPFAPAALAVVLWALWRHYFRYRDIEYVRTLWQDLICRGADWLCSLYDERLGLPRPGRTLWDRSRGLDAFTIGSIYGALIAAKNFAVCFGDSERVARCTQGAELIRSGVERHFYDTRTERLGSRLHLSDDGQYELHDHTDSSLTALVRFGVLDADDPHVVSAMSTICDRLWVKTPVGGLVRFEGDWPGGTEPPLVVGVAGHSDVVATLWLAQYLVARSSDVAELREAMPVFEWAVTNASSAGLVPGQLDPTTGQARSGQPDLLAHAEFVIALANYLEKLEQVQICPSCGQSVYRMRRHWPLKVTVQDLLAKYAEDGDVEVRRTDSVVVFEHDEKEVTLAIDERECIGCGVCSIQCTENVIVMIADKAKVDLTRLTRCTVCMACRESCPINAVRIATTAQEQLHAEHMR